MSVSLFVHSYDLFLFFNIQIYLVSLSPHFAESAARNPPVRFLFAYFSLVLSSRVCVCVRDGSVASGLVCRV